MSLKAEWTPCIQEEIKAEPSEASPKESNILGVLGVAVILAEPVGENKIAGKDQYVVLTINGQTQ